MYVPKGWHWFFPTLLVLLGFYIHEHVNSGWDVILFVNVPLACIALQWGAYIWQAGVVYQKYITGMPKSSEEEIETPKLINWNTGEEIAREPFEIENAYTQIVELPKFDAERRFAIDVLRMYDIEPDTQMFVDLTEERWVVQKKRFAQKPFANLKKKWEYFGVLKRKNRNKNSPYVVKKREAVALIASGNKLPDWPPPPSN